MKIIEDSSVELAWLFGKAFRALQSSKNEIMVTVLDEKGW